MAKKNQVEGGGGVIEVGSDKEGVETRERHDLHTHLNRRSEITGSLERISISTLSGR